MMNTDKLFNNDANQKIGMMETMYRIMSHITEDGVPLMDPALYDKKPDNVEEEENDIGKQ